MTPSQMDREAAAQWMERRYGEGHLTAEYFREGKNDQAELVQAFTRHRLAAEAAAFEKAAGVFRECVVQQARDVAIRPVSPQSPGEWRDAVRQAAIRKLAGEKHD